MTHQLLVSPSPPPPPLLRPYRVSNCNRTLRKGIMAESLEDLQEKVRSVLETLFLKGQGWTSQRSPRAFFPLPQVRSAFLLAGNVSLVLDEDGTIVETEEFFQTLKDGTVI
ncbi:hypothetical protein JD844_015077 [Phrynosoma platyrhinos]|uniref:CIDE-N domain-containing protein n=1 Tax=Phrynosoma platyrhinos TaxID=52577 RepID=A0ABQ7T792_PHRPL|nr:hypothetical protein JD844_015077 [Phrynosoma platyrhinos]